MNRSEFLSSLVGRPYILSGKGEQGWDCYNLAAHVQQVLFGRKLPYVEVPENSTWQWIVHTIESHPERVNWRVVQPDSMGLVSVRDGAMVLMARHNRPAHVGVWCTPERGILHADVPSVMFDTPATLRATGWRRLLYYEYRDQ